MALSDVKRVQIQHLQQAKRDGEKISMLTAYDFPSAQIFDQSGLDMLLVGDSIGDNMLGFDNTLPVTLDHMVVATRAVATGAKRALVVTDLPFGTFESSPAQAHASAVRVLKEGGGRAVKLEGGANIAPQIELLSKHGIPVMGHLGLTPQAEYSLGGKRMQAKDEAAADALVDNALAVQEAGAFAIVLELIPERVTARVTEVLDIPTIGIGAGNVADGQVLVWHDLAGYGDWSPKFAKQYTNIRGQLLQAAGEYVQEVRSGAFPGPEHTIA